jgi:hypothetical protein
MTSTTDENEPPDMVATTNNTILMHTSTTTPCSTSTEIWSSIISVKLLALILITCFSTQLPLSQSSSSGDCRPSIGFYPNYQLLCTTSIGLYSAGAIWSENGNPKNNQLFWHDLTDKNTCSDNNNYPTILTDWLQQYKICNDDDHHFGNKLIPEEIKKSQIIFEQSILLLILSTIATIIFACLDVIPTCSKCKKRCEQPCRFALVVLIHLLISSIGILMCYLALKLWEYSPMINDLITLKMNNIPVWSFTIVPNHDDFFPRLKLIRSEGGLNNKLDLITLVSHTYQRSTGYYCLVIGNMLFLLCFLIEISLLLSTMAWLIHYSTSNNKLSSSTSGSRIFYTNDENSEDENGIIEMMSDRNDNQQLLGSRLSPIPIATVVTTRQSTSQYHYYHQAEVVDGIAVTFSSSSNNNQQGNNNNDDGGSGSNVASV